MVKKKGETKMKERSDCLTELFYFSGRYKISDGGRHVRLINTAKIIPLSDEVSISQRVHFRHTNEKDLLFCVENKLRLETMLKTKY